MDRSGIPMHQTRKKARRREVPTVKEPFFSVGSSLAGIWLSGVVGYTSGVILQVTANLALRRINADRTVMRLDL